jgi:hypothetical protein
MMSARQASAPHGWRLELFYKSAADLQAQVAVLRKYNVRRVNITNKSDQDQLLDNVSTLQAQLPDIDVCVHYSIKYNYQRSVTASLQRLQQFCADFQRQLGAHPTSSGHVLLVSGGGKKRALETVSALQQLSDGTGKPAPGVSALGRSRGRQLSLGDLRSSQPLPPPGQQQQQQQQRQQEGFKQPGQLPDLYVAFNPYLPDPQQHAAELARLEPKLATGRVAGVYLQMGTDLTRLTSGLQHLHHLLEQQQQQRPQQHSSSQEAQQLGKAAEQQQQPAGQTLCVVYGSVFLPTPRLLAQMRFRPWNGVFLSEEYLSSVPAADSITRQLLRVYAAHGVVPLVESAVKREADMQQLQELLQSAGFKVDVGHDK